MISFQISRVEKSWPINIPLFFLFAHRAQLARAPNFSPQFRHLWTDYTTLTKTKLYDLTGGGGGATTFGGGRGGAYQIGGGGSGAFGVRASSKEDFDEEDLTEAKEAVAKYVKAGRKIPQSMHEVRTILGRVSNHKSKFLLKKLNNISIL